MSDPYEQALKQLKKDKRSLNELGKLIGIPYETLRDIKNGITKSPGYATLKKLAAHYGEQQAA